MADSKFPNRGPMVLVVATTTIAITTIVVAARAVSKTWIVKKLSLDDYLIALAWLIACGLSFSIDFSTTKGLGRDMSDIKPEWMIDMKRTNYIFSVLYNPALVVTKSSILVFYLRLFKNTPKFYRTMSYITLALVNIAGIGLTFVCIFQCQPFKAAFIPMLNTNVSCTNIVHLYLSAAPVNIITDLSILVLPIPILTSITLPRKQKNILIFTFALGIFVIIVDVIRIYYLQRAYADLLALTTPPPNLIVPPHEAAPNPAPGHRTNYAWYASIALMWTSVEVNVGIICACIPSLKPLISRLKPHWIDHVVKPHISENLAYHRARYGAGNVLRVGRSGTSRSEPGSVQHEAHTRIPSDNETWAQSSIRNSLQQRPRQMSAVTTVVTRDSANTLYFGFVNMRRPGSMLKTAGKEMVQYCSVVTVLFFLWGFSYGLLNVLNNHISEVYDESKAENLGLSSIYFSSYLFGALIGWCVLHKVNFKATFITGVVVYGIGTLIFWPCAILGSFPGFLVSTFIVGLGLSIVETASNPFLALCGPNQYSETRLLLAQGVQSVAGLISPLLAEKVFFQDVNQKASLIDVQWTYLAIAFFDVILALFFYYMPLPEATDADLEEENSPKLLHIPTNSSLESSLKFLGRYPVVLITLGAGVLAQFFYVSAQESISVNVPDLLEFVAKRAHTQLFMSVDNFELLAKAHFTIGRFLFAGLTFFIAPRILLLIAFSGSTVFSILLVALRGRSTSSLDAIAAASSLIYFFEGPIFPLIFAICLRGLGRHTKAGAGLLTAAVSGGGIGPFAMYGISKHRGTRIKQYSFLVVVAFFVYGVLFGVYLNVTPKARGQVEVRRISRDGGGGRQGSQNVALVNVRQGAGGRTRSSTFSEAFSKMVGKVKSRDSAVASAEHRETRREGSDD